MLFCFFFFFFFFVIKKNTAPRDSFFTAHFLTLTEGFRKHHVRTVLCFAEKENLKAISLNHQ